MEQYVITISRQFGSMGRSIARELSEILGIEFLDRDIVEATAKRMGLPVSVISDEEESMKSTFFRRQYPLGMGMSSLKDEIFLTQKNIIRDADGSPDGKENDAGCGCCQKSLPQSLYSRLAERFRP